MFLSAHKSYIKVTRNVCLIFFNNILQIFLYIFPRYSSHYKHFCSAGILSNFFNIYGSWHVVYSVTWHLASVCAVSGVKIFRITLVSDARFNTYKKCIFLFSFLLKTLQCSPTNLCIKEIQIL